MVYETAGAIDLPVIGCGGISNASDAIEFFMAGASAVQIGTATFVDPGIPVNIIEGIENFMLKKGIENISQMIGNARK
jgi:dihydroorotate dehydrogenase (NAD+) catalytic subunit